MRQCEALLAEMTCALAEVRRAAEALQTRRRVIQAAVSLATWLDSDIDAAPTC